MQIITLKWLESIDMCYEFIEVYKKHWPDSIPANQAIRTLISGNLTPDKKERWNLIWANWLIVYCMNRRQVIEYAIYAAEQVIEVYEAQFAGDDRPRKGIEAAKKYLSDPLKISAADLANAAAVASDATDAAVEATAAYTEAYAAVYTAAAADYTAAAAAYTAADAKTADADAKVAYAAKVADAAADAAYAAAKVAKAAAKTADAAAEYNAALKSIILYGVELLEQRG